MDESVPVTVVDGDEETTLSVAEGRVLRDALLEAGFDVYGAVSRRANCGGDVLSVGYMPSVTEFVTGYKCQDCEWRETDR